MKNISFFKKAVILLLVMTSFEAFGSNYYCEAQCGGFVSTGLAGAFAELPYRKFYQDFGMAWGEGSSMSSAFDEAKDRCDDKGGRLHHGFIGQYAYDTGTGKIIAGQLREATPASACHASN